MGMIKTSKFDKKKIRTCDSFTTCPKCDAQIPSHYQRCPKCQFKLK